MGLIADLFGIIADGVEDLCDAVGNTVEEIGDAVGSMMDEVVGEGSGNRVREAGRNSNERWRRRGDAFHDALDGVGQSIEYFLMTRHKIFDSVTERNVPSIPKLEAYSFNNAVVENQFAYDDNGIRFEFRINDKGNIEFKEKTGNKEEWKLVSPPSKYLHPKDYNGHVEPPVAISYTTRRGKGKDQKNERDFHMYVAPKFDMIAADGSRIFAKESGKDNFYVTTMEHEYLHYSYSDVQCTKKDHVNVPGFEFKLDPEYNQDTSNPDDLGWWTSDEYGNHPSVKLYQEIRLKMAKALITPDIMMTRAEPRVWHLLDTRPPCGSGKPPRWVRKYDHVTYQDLGPLGNFKKKIRLLTHQPSIEFIKVFDIGVGNMHRHTHYEIINGGEMQNGPDIFLTGPTKDRAGFWDGTCNFYILCQLKSDYKIKKDGNTKDAYAILWIDHQTYFSERWRVVHPEDNLAGLFRDWALVGAVKSLLPWIREKHKFNRDSFWCPFRNGCINSNSRMAVSRQTIIVTGKKEIYSINFSWGSMDHTWRWRHYPPCTIKYLSSDDVVTGRQTIRIDESYPDSVYPQTIALREDMTIYMKGTKKIGKRIVKGVWYQKYLPASNLEVPDENELGRSGKPVTGYDHPWHFMTEDVFKVADLYSHLGAYNSEPINSRSQYYEVIIDNTQNVDELVERCWVDINKKLHVSELITSRFSESVSLFNKKTMLAFRKGIRNEPIVVWWDKKDDDLMSMNSFEEEIVLESNDAEKKQIKICLKKNVRIWHPPIVNKVKIILNEHEKIITFWFESKMEKPPRWIRDEGRAAIDNWIPCTDNSISRIKIYVLENNSPRIIFDRRKIDFHRDNDFEFFYVLNCRDENTFVNMSHYFSEPIIYNVGTSIVFEGILGHVATPEQICIQNE